MSTNLLTGALCTALGAGVYHYVVAPRLTAKPLVKGFLPSYDHAVKTLRGQRFGALATTAAGDSKPHVRHVLYKLDAAGENILVYGHVGAEKVKDVRAHPFAELAIYDSASRTQVRVSGPAVVHHNDAVAHAQWTALATKDHVTQKSPPGAAYSPERVPVDEAEGNFSVIEVAVRGVDCVVLGQPREPFRVRFAVGDKGAVTQQTRVME